MQLNFTNAPQLNRRRSIGWHIFFFRLSLLSDYGRQVVMHLISPLRNGKNDVEAEIYGKSKNTNH